MVAETNWTKVGSIGSIIGGIAAIGAAVLLALSLCKVKEQVDAMQRQTELENRGFLAIVIDSFWLQHVPPKVIIKYQFYETSRIPILVKHPRLEMLSTKREVDVPVFIEEVKNELAGQYITKYVYVYSKPDSSIADPPSVLLNKIRSFNDGVVNSFDSEFFFHVIFRYEDITGNDYWVYMRWKFYIKRTQQEDRLEGIDAISRETYVIWEVKEEVVFPDTLNLPEELVELTQKARLGEFAY